jgi:hypothetical protein
MTPMAATAGSAATEYLDLDGDGVPDAVRTRQTMVYDTSRDGCIDLVETLEELATGIDITGVPRAIHVVDTLESDFGVDGRARTVDSIEYDVEPDPT